MEKVIIDYNQVDIIEGTCSSFCSVSFAIELIVLSANVGRSLFLESVGLREAGTFQKVPQVAIVRPEVQVSERQLRRRKGLELDKILSPE
jgi:hypothetical protein